MAQSQSRAMARKAFRPLFIGPWLTKLNRKPREVCQASGVDESYMSQLISGEKQNPSADVLMRISEELGISVNALYRRPPEMDVTDRVQKLSPEQFEALTSILDEFKPDSPRK